MHIELVVCTIAAVNAIIGPDSTAEVDVPKLKQKERLLKTKIEVLAKLDEVILESASEEQLEEEVQQADEYVENIELAVSQILEFLAKLESTDERSLHPVPNHQPRLYQRSLSSLHMSALAPITQGSRRLRVLVREPPLRIWNPQYLIPLE